MGLENLQELPDDPCGFQRIVNTDSGDPERYPGLHAAFVIGPGSEPSITRLSTVKKCPFDAIGLAI